ncbi:MAG: cytochrome c [Planctomycetota bacterium]
MAKTDDIINKQVEEILSSNSPSTLMGARGVLRFNAVPRWLVYLVIISIVASFVPLVQAINSKFGTSEKPRVHLFQGMDNQPKYKAQASNELFGNDMAMRPLVPGTIARGNLTEDDFFNRGFSIVGVNDDGSYDVDWFDGFPEQFEVNDESLARGKELWARYCYLCHGFDGYGNGPIHVRAMQNVQGNPNWVQPSSMHDAVRRGRPTGHIYNTTSNGIRNMAGYAQQIPDPQDRWAIVAYVRALQLSQNASPEMIPEALRGDVPVRGTFVSGREQLLIVEAEDEPTDPLPGTPERAKSDGDEDSEADADTPNESPE